MTYRGKVKNGVVVLDGEAMLPEGVVVRVEPVEATKPKTGATVYKRLAEIAGKAAGLPPDLARQHDHYLHGQARR
ncbi:MAG: hypothetical protein KAV82_06335 [Phycisphaerae bacterium]|nr:hypothetical protein [Phycisphaerae bacterium]